MAAVKYQGSSSSTFSHCKYEVFLSFRGKDTRKNFTDHLYKALVQAGIRTFRDDDEIRRGENIELELENAIKQSRISIIVFSKDYASSRWCLDELVMIMEQRRTAGWVVLPVFYGVEPSHVRHQTGSFAVSFEEHEKRFKEEMERVNGWRIALKEVADLGGMELRDGYEARFVQSIVMEVSKKLDRRVFHFPFHFIGREYLIDYMNSWLRDESHPAAIFVLYGIGGVGKTTIAKSVYNQNLEKFEGRSFLANVRERIASEKSNGLVSLQRQLLSDILNKTANEIHDVDEGTMKIKHAICCRRTLVVVDDVNERDKLEAIVGSPNWQFQGSKVIVTTRNKGLIASHDEFVECKVEPLDDKESLELFSWHAFGQAHPSEDFAEHSRRIVHHCNGLPLALRVIGSSLSGKRTRVWESALREMEVIPNSEVHEVLRVSYKSLDDDYQKSLFLDIACFFNGMDEDYVVKILDGLGIGAAFRIDNLIDRCLLDIDRNKRLWMHQIIREMGRTIALKKSTKCQRVWNHKEAFEILKETTDTETVRGLILDMHDFSKQCRLPRLFSREGLSNFLFGQTCSVPLLGTDAFRKMKNVKFLQLNHAQFNGSYEHFPKSLLWLCWHGFPLRSIPKQFRLEKLVVLDMCGSSLVDAWKGKMPLPKLRILDLSHSRALIKTPDLSGLSSLETLILEDCILLDQIHESVGDLQNLEVLNLRNCKSLVELPEEELRRLNSLKDLNLEGCSSLVSDMEFEHLQRKSLLQPDGIVASISYITTMPLKLFSRSWFSARKNSRFSSFSFPRSLIMLNLSGIPLSSLPENIKDLNMLESLWVAECRFLQSLPALPSNLQALNLTSCPSLEMVTNLTPFVVVYDCDQLVNVQDLIRLELIQKADLHMFKVLEMVSLQMQPLSFQILHKDNIFSVLLPGNQCLRFYQEEDERVVQKEFVNLSFKISAPAEDRACCFNLFARFTAMSELVFDCSDVYVIIKNNTKGRSKVLHPRFSPMIILDEIVESLFLSHWKCGGDDHLDFDNGDEVRISVRTNDPRVLIKTIGLRILYEKKGNDGIQSNNEVNSCDISSSNNQVSTACSSSSNNEVITEHNSSSSPGSQTLGNGHLTKEEIASEIFRNYYCDTRYIWSQYMCHFRKKSVGGKRN